MIKAMLVDNNNLNALKLETKNVKVDATAIQIDFYAKNHSKTIIPDQLFLYHNDRRFRVLDFEEKRVITNGDSITIDFLTPWNSTPIKRIN